jgi:hypothetical protein
MTNLTISRLDENNVTALYRRYPGMLRPQPCLLTLDVAAGSFSAGFDEERSGGPGEPVFDRLVLRWPIPCLTASAANQVLRELAPQAAEVLAAAVIGWRGVIDIAEGVDQVGAAVLSSKAARAADCIAVLLKNIGHMVNLADEVIREKDARGWFTEDDFQEYEITAETTDEQLRALAGELELVGASPNARPVVVVLGLLEYLTEFRDSLR